ncbi:MAG TPA: TIGR03936 family radical SAM-associated protein [Candidatus Latescibacteria bacterium]|nr:TIGR03936 family radical SAM-associated protein [Candidatus Latescibacterota bacterium]
MVDGTAAFCRLHYSVGNAAAALGYREIMPLIQSALADAGVLARNPDGTMSKLRFGPPLPAGCSSMREYCDAELDYASDDVLSRINSRTCDGLQFVQCDRIDRKAEPLDRIAFYAEYSFEVPHSLLRECDLKALRELFDEQREWLAERVSPKGHVRESDLKKAVTNWRCESGDNVTTVHLRLTIVHEEGHTASPTLVLQKLFGLNEEQSALVAITRREMFDRSGAPLRSTPWPRRRNRLLYERCWEHQRFNHQ